MRPTQHVLTFVIYINVHVNIFNSISNKNNVNFSIKKKEKKGNTSQL